MIYTITTNPSLDYQMIFSKEVITGEHNRSNIESFDAGGKGVNVSIFLNNLGIQSACLGFLGGFTKDVYLSKLTAYPCIQPLFTNIKDNTRINIKALSNDCLTSLNALGPHISDEEYNKFITRASRIYDDDYIVVSGSVQNELEDKIVSLVNELSSVGTKVILDTEEGLTLKCLECKPSLVKLNDQNAGIDENDIISKAQEYISKGAKVVIYSSPINPNYYMFFEDKYYKTQREDKVLHTTGSGDSMIAGYLYSCLRGANLLESFKYSVVCSKCLSFVKPTDRELIETEFNKLKVEEF